MLCKYPHLKELGQSDTAFPASGVHHQRAVPFDYQMAPADEQARWHMMLFGIT
jgi:hypothetical protein